jgi:hypothetical protein
MHGKKRFWIPVAILVGVSVFSTLLLALWNWLMPAIFGLPFITIYQALGLLVLSKILFSGFHHRGRHVHFDRETCRKEFERKMSNTPSPGEEEGK